MEHAKGIQLHQLRPSISLEQQIACTGAIFRIIKQMMTFYFNVLAACISRTLRLIPHWSILLRQPMLLDLIAELRTGMAMFPSQSFTAQ